MKRQQTRQTRPVKAVRDELRREEIVTAARYCVVRHGFHAASMAQIATQAGMSVGQIYRYFASKEAIVHAIVERIVKQRLAWIADTDGRADLPKILASRMLDDAMSDADDRVLLLEVTAEATRNAEVAAIVRDADRLLLAESVRKVRQNHPGLSEREATVRVEFMAVLHEGTAFRRITELRADKTALARLYRNVIAELFPSP